MYLPLEGNIQQASYERQSEVCVFRGYSLPIHQAMGMPTLTPISLAIFHSFSNVEMNVSVHLVSKTITSLTVPCYRDTLGWIEIGTLSLPRFICLTFAAYKDAFKNSNPSQPAP